MVTDGDGLESWCFEIVHMRQESNVYYQDTLSPLEMKAEEERKQ